MNNSYNITQHMTAINFDKLKENYYEIIGSTWLVDSVYVFLVTPMATISFCLNLLSFVAFIKIKNQQSSSNLTNYFKIYTLSSLIASFVSGLYLFTAPHYFSFVNSYWIGIYCCKISQYCLTLYFFCNVLDCFILFERLTNFVDQLKKYSNGK